jgi:carbon starvation protein
MSPAVAAVLAMVVYGVGYRVYGRYLARGVFKLDAQRPTPAHTMRDDVDYIPTRKGVLFGHHFASIAGLAPMLGPAVAVVWGWLPALVWVVVGALLIGCVHDMSALVISARSKGMSVGEVAGEVISKRTRVLFLLIIFFGVALAMGVFVYVLARLFGLKQDGGLGYEAAVLPSGLMMVVAVAAGLLMRFKGVGLGAVTVVGGALSLVGVWMGLRWPTMGLDSGYWPGLTPWTWLLLGYAFLASVLPVWTLLQPRDFLNGLLLYLGLGLAYLGLMVGQPAFDAPALVSAPEGAPPMLPYVFIIVACGAVSGFHGLVSSGTTAKQLDKETDALPIGYGAMIGESLLGLLAVLACTAGFGSSGEWHAHYSGWAAVQGLGRQIDLFIQGASSFVMALGIGEGEAKGLIAVVVVSFALTTLDSATRLLRFNIEELAQVAGLKWVQNRYLSSALACLTIALFAFYEVGGQPAALALWQLFGTTNQLLAGLTLALATVYLKKRGWPAWPTAVPGVFILLTALGAMTQNLWRFATGPEPSALLIGVGGALLILGLWVVIEAGLALRASSAQRAPQQP